MWIGRHKPVFAALKTSVETGNCPKAGDGRTLSNSGKADSQESW